MSSKPEPLASVSMLAKSSPGVAHSAPAQPPFLALGSDGTLLRILNIITVFKT